MRNKLTMISLLSVALSFLVVSFAGAQIVPEPQTQVLLPGDQIPKFADPLPELNKGISVVDVTAKRSYNIYMIEFPAQVLPGQGFTGTGGDGLPFSIKKNSKTKVWGYRTDGDILQINRPTYIGPVVVAKRGNPVKARYQNFLPFDGFSAVQPLLPVDLTLSWANPLGINCLPVLNPNTGLLEYTNPACGVLPSYKGPVPASPHLHGGEVPPGSDGGPDAWFTPLQLKKGIGFVSNTLNYPNGQEAASIWFHDHALGITRLNVYAGMAGAYLITDPANEPAGLPSGKYDVPLVIQDRSFDTKGQLFYNLASNPQPNPTVHPFWIPEFIGDAIVVNGKTWPFLNVEPRKYRFRVLNGSQARFFNLSFGGLSFQVIATDGGYLDTPAPSDVLLIGPGERYEIVVDFAGATSPIVVTNDAATPFPGGDPVVAGTTDTIMQFRVVALSATDTSVVPSDLRPTNDIVRLPTSGTVITRQLTLNEIASNDGPLGLVLNNTGYNTVIAGFGDNRNSEQPAVGDTEIWEIINISADAHPIHLHLVQFQIINREALTATNTDPISGEPIIDWVTVYDNALTTANVGPGEGPPNSYLTRNDDGAIGGNPALTGFLTGTKILPGAYEAGWKDTAIMYPGEVTRIAVRWAPTNIALDGVIAGQNKYPFDPLELISGVGYVWHCHILEHEDNEMMRPYTVETTRQIP